jgi:putative membrane protein
MNSLLAFLHHIAAFVLFTALFIELVLIKGDLTLWSARKLLLYDLIFGISAGIVLIIGFLRVAYFEKGAYYYFHSVPFIAKISLFAIAGVVSIYPTMEFLSWRAALKRGEVPTLTAGTRRRLASLIHGELTAIALIILCAVLMARGVGYFG